MMERHFDARTIESSFCTPFPSASLPVVRTSAFYQTPPGGARQAPSLWVPMRVSPSLPLASFIPLLFSYLSSYIRAREVA
jgi:hypothetical protein